MLAYRTEAIELGKDKKKNEWKMENKIRDEEKSKVVREESR